MIDEQVLKELRAICLAFPGATETASWGYPNFRTSKRIFAAFDEYHGQQYIAFIAPPELVEELAQRQHFSRSGYRGWVLRDLEALDWTELTGLLEQAYRLAALSKPKAKIKPR